jgi:hypothetical protein
MSEEAEAKLLIAQLRHTVEMLRAENRSLETQLTHDREMWTHRLGELERQACDFETRIREATAGTEQFKLYLRYVGAGAGGGVALGGLALLSQVLGGG